MKTRKIVVVILAIALCLTGCTAQNGQTAPEKDPVDSKVSSGTPSIFPSMSQPESAETSSAMADNSQSESAVSQSASVSASESTVPQSETIGKQISWADKACAPVTFAEDPAGCISYAMWKELEEHLEYIEKLEISQEEKQEFIQQNLERADPQLIYTARLADLNRDGVPELLLEELGGWAAGISVNDLSEQEPTFVTNIIGGGIQFSIDYVYNETGTVVARVSSCSGHSKYNYDFLNFMEKQTDGSWDVWECETELIGWEAEELVVTDTQVAHNLQQVDDPDDSLYNQLVSRSVAQPQVPYVELDEMDVYNETLSTGEDWWIAYGRMLWDEYQQALQQTETVG